ncbi:hypothetical protein [Streptomyces sp. NBC_01373]|uniref:hypothetical protein n=1 Tax=Streptomyces sp. NBC_01373 TaxID=2903843 RepID=UPI00225270E7|nr:hypothetical protein [Streptomyces sp. NBC_01373]MCX4697064.1 hypothetical protein [Streptomyces sp. NBC_01373]MCX4707011.1 hypothetical protein [Streptomyces sp. NBC_01373]
MPPVSQPDLERLARLARRRRADLGVALNDANAKAGGTSKHTWQRVEKSLPIRETNYVKIDGLLEWAPGSCIAVLEGGEPVPVGEIADNPEGQKSPVPPEVLERERVETVQLALIATAKGTSAEEIREMSERVVRDLRERGLI